MTLWEFGISLRAALGRLSHALRLGGLDGPNVLCLHGVAPKADGEPRALVISPESLVGLLRALSAAGVEVVPLSQIEQGAQHPCIALTFDDGSDTFVRYALPVLNEFRVPATLFVCSDYVKDPRRRWPDYPAGAAAPMSEATLFAILRDHPRIEVGSHGHGHVDLRLVDDRAARLRESRDLIVNELGQTPRIAWPFGAVDAAVREDAMTAGFLYAYGVALGPTRRVLARTGPAEWTRSLAVGGAKSLFGIANGSDARVAVALRRLRG